MEATEKDDVKRGTRLKHGHTVPLTPQAQNFN